MTRLPDPRTYFTAEEVDRARRYHRPSRRVGWVGAGVWLGLLISLTFTPARGGLAAPVDGLPRWAFALSYASLVTVAGAVIRLPISVWRGHLHERRWGFSTRGLGSWFVDWMQSGGSS